MSRPTSATTPTSCCGSRRSRASRHGRRRRASRRQGRPGWHIECSAMAWKHLGEKFDIHGGGIDLVFPHHENELAQTCCAFHADRMANVWMHNGFLQVESEKMSKSLGNFFTIRELLADWPGEVLRLNMLKTHYRSPLDWTLKGAGREREDARRLVCGRGRRRGRSAVDGVIEALSDDLNTAQAMAVAARPAQCGGIRRRARTRRVRGLAPAARLPLRECCGMEGTQAAGERRRCEAGRSPDCGAHRRARAKGLQGVRPHPRRTRRDGRCHQGRQGCRRKTRDHLGDRVMTSPIRLSQNTGAITSSSRWR